MPKELIDIILIDLFILAVPLVMYFFPPKNINAIYGYRTTRSMKNIDNWRFAQKYVAKRWLAVPLVILVAQLLWLFFTDLDLKSQSSTMLPISMALFLIGTFICIFLTERKLKRMLYQG